MNDRLNLPKGEAMKLAVLSLATFTTIFLVGCAQPATGELPVTETDVNKKDLIKEYALHDAVRAKDIEQVKLLVENKSEVNGKDYYGYTPLHLAVRLNQFEITEYLIQNKAEVNSEDNYKDTPLLDATRDDSSELSKLLICNGADRQVQDRYDMTPLHYSVKNKNRLISEILLARDIKPFCTEEEEAPVTQEVPEIIEENTPEVDEAKPQETEELPLSQAPEFEGLYEALEEEFKSELIPWNAELTQDLQFRFNDPAALFQVDKSELKVGFTDILTDFFPRYLKVLEKHKDKIQEIRVEGHTSSEYEAAKTDEERYRFNMLLSENRALSVRDYTIQTAKENSDIDSVWVEEVLKPYGMAYDNLILNPDGTENKDASRRVEFKIIKK